MRFDTRWLGVALCAIASCGPNVCATNCTDASADGASADSASADAMAGDGAAASCSMPGAVTTATPATAESPTSNFNVTLLACTKTATALGCELGSAHSYSEVVEGTVRRIRANGIPNHDVGTFPNPGNPNSIAAQSYQYAVPVTPAGAGAPAMVFGILRSGVVLDPGTAERWNDSNNWNYEALRYATAPPYFTGAGATDATRHPTALGVDCNFAHVQPGGAYHYHGVPTAAMPAEARQTFVGWAGDGYPIIGRWDHQQPMDPSSAVAEMRSSYRLRTGTRPSGTAGPGGAYDGTFVQDWEYVAGSGDLDECNGRQGVVTIDGRQVTTYHYVLTHTYPYIPRCFHSAPDTTFQGRRPMGG
jgi:YHYH protein